MYEFEKHPKLTEFIQEMANTGKAPYEWTSFIETLNQALRIHDVVGRSEQLKDMVFKLANELAVAEHGEQAVKMHMIHNSL